MKPMAWSYSSLDDFKNCPKAFHAKRVAKTVQESPSEQMIWGNKVHKCFELRQKDDTPLPDYLEEHEPLMQELDAYSGEKYTERRIALDTRRQPCGFFDANVWMRGIIDFSLVHDGGALLVDYKTGKPHSKFEQLQLFALHTFAEFPHVNYVTAQFYWTKTKTTTEQTYDRDQIKSMWSKFAPDLQQYVQAFKQDVWQPRPSGLCNGWCPVTNCEFWKPKRKR